MKKQQILAGLERSSAGSSTALTGAILAAFLLVMTPLSASAILMTLTFDDGDYDHSIVSEGGESHGPYDWVESNGIRATGFWATDVGTPAGDFQQGHTHITPNFSGRPDGRAERMHSWTDDLQGLNISLESGQTFDIVSIDYSLREHEILGDPLLDRLPWSYDVNDGQLLLNTGWDPAAADIDGEWTAFAITDGGSPFNPWYTLNITGFDNITNFFISHTTAQTEIDTIVIDVHDSTPIPEPGTALLMGLGLVGLATRKRSA